MICVLLSDEVVLFRQVVDHGRFAWGDVAALSVLARIEPVIGNGKVD